MAKRGRVCGSACPSARRDMTFPPLGLPDGEPPKPLRPWVRRFWRWLRRVVWLFVQPI
jgi:hypothetical protein